MEGEYVFRADVSASFAGDVGPAGSVECCPDEVVEGAHDGRCAVAADLAGILGEGDGLDSVDLVFGDPLSPAPGSQLGRGRFVDFEVGEVTTCSSRTPSHP